MIKDLINILMTKGLLLMAANLCYAQTWLPVGSGIGCGGGELVRTIKVSDNNEYLYITGIIGGNSNCNEPKATLVWDGSEYHQLANHNGHAQASLAFDYLGNTYVSGYFIQQPSPENNLYYIDENDNWSFVPNSIRGTFRDYLIRDGIVYITGALSYCGGQPCAYVCTYDGEQVLPYCIVDEPDNDYARSLVFYQDTLFVTGSINSLNPNESQSGYCNLVKIVNGQLQKVAQGFSSQGMGAGVEVLDDKLYIGGWLKAIGDSQFHSIFYYQDGQLHALPEEPDGLIFATTTYQDGLYVAGDFTQIGNTPCNQVARWDGHEWTCLCHEPFQRVVIDENDDTLAVQPCMNQCIKDITVWNDTLYVGGAFHQIGNTTARAIAKLDMALSEVFPVHITEQQKQEFELNIYPNPVKQELNFTLPLGADAKDIIGIYDVRGRLIKEQVAGKYGGNIGIDVGTLPAGMYVLKYTGANEMYHQSFIKE